MATTLTATIIQATLQRARDSPRRRAVHCFHAPDDVLQRMVNAALEDTYVRPHLHPDAGKLEIFTILRGTVAIPFFDDAGGILECSLLEAYGPIRGVEIPPGTWHSFVVFSQEAVLYETINGRYDPATHKRFAPWAPPEEDAAAAQRYLADLKRRLRDSHGTARASPAP